MLGGAALGDEPFDDGHDVIGGAGPATSMASASRVNSSTMLHSFSLLRSAVSSNWKSMAHTWLGRSAR
jgi:hypothetical protein